MNGSQVVATTADPAFAVDCSGKIIAWNAAAARALGYETAAVVGRPCWAVLEGRDLSANRYCDKTCPLRTMALAGEPIHRSRMFFRSAAGAMTGFSLSSLAVEGAGGKELVHLLESLSPDDGQPPPAPVSSSTDHAMGRLSPRQMEVLELLADGKGTREIAEVLCIAPATVRHHVQRILRRLRTHRRLEAVALARRIGLL